ncbi:hypothetical protein [Methanothrix sp.]
MKTAAHFSAASISFALLFCTPPGYRARGPLAGDAGDGFVGL